MRGFKVRVLDVEPFGPTGMIVGMPTIILPQQGDKPWADTLNTAIRAVNAAVDDAERDVNAVEVRVTAVEAKNPPGGGAGISGVSTWASEAVIPSPVDGVIYFVKA